MTWKDNSARYEKDTTRVVLPRRKKDHNVAIAKIQLEAQFASTHAYTWVAVYFTCFGVLVAAWIALILWNYSLMLSSDLWVNGVFVILLLVLRTLARSKQKEANETEAALLAELDKLK